MRSIIEKYKIDGIWHFTDEANFKSIIQQGGLLSYTELGRRKVSIPVAGGNEWSHEADAFAGVDDYVHLAFISNHPMLYLAKKENRIKKPYWLKVDVSVLLANDVRFTREVANKSGATILTAEQAKDEVDFAALFTRMDWSDPAIKARRRAAEKSQILVPKFIPCEKILGKCDG